METISKSTIAIGKDAYKQNLKFFNQKNLRQCQLKQLSILKEIDIICRKHNITYWLDGGTLLGAVRHQGFIPWDDDIDIAMGYKDMKRFEVIALDELPDWLFLQTPQTDPYVKEQMVKIRDANSLYIENGDSFQYEYVKSVYVDIFPFVKHPDIPKAWTRRLCRGICKSISILHKQHYYSIRAIAEFFWFGGKLLLYKGIWNILKAFYKSTRYANLPQANGYGITHQQDTVLPTSSITFEGHDFPAPHDPDQYLRNIYGNYMELPPIEKRHFHSVCIIPELVTTE